MGPWGDLAAKVQMLTGTKIGIREIPDDPDNRSLNIAPRRKLQGIFFLNWRLAGTWDKQVTICLRIIIELKGGPA